jgi:hypothetical protein
MATKAERINGKPEVKKKSSNNKNKRKKPIKIAGRWTLYFVSAERIKMFCKYSLVWRKFFYLNDTMTSVTFLFREYDWDQKAEESGHSCTTDTGSR